MINADEFNITDTGNKSIRLVHCITNRQFGEHFQEACRSPAWKSAGIIIEKYKRKYPLAHSDLIDLREYLEKFINDRIAQGKKCSNDFITQEASAYIKKLGEARLKEKEEKEFLEGA